MTSPRHSATSNAEFVPDVFTRAIATLFVAGRHCYRVLSMPAHVSAPLLSTYLTAASRQVGEGAPISERSRWAIDHAIYQLRANREVLAGDTQFLAPATNAGMRQLESESGPDLAEIVLQSDPDGGGQSAQASEKRALARLDSVLDDLEAIAADEHSTAARSGAERLARIFGAPPQLAAA
jgi:hypothetical protein